LSPRRSNVPYFCWHPAMHSVAPVASAPQVLQGRRRHTGWIVMSCVMPVSEGMRVSIDDPEAVKLRARVIEWLMLNHPHDCPVCDEGGECHLQDMTVMADTRSAHPLCQADLHQPGPGPVPHARDEPLHPVLPLRAVLRRLRRRADLNVFGWHDAVYFGRSEEGRLESPFQRQPGGSLPDGRVHDKTLAQHYSGSGTCRPPPRSACTAAWACNTIPGSPIRPTAADSRSLQWPGQWLLPLRPRPLRLRVRPLSAAELPSRCCAAPTAA